MKREIFKRGAGGKIKGKFGAIRHVRIAITSALIAVLLLIGWPPTGIPVQAASSGPNYPTAAVSDSSNGGTRSWSSLGNVNANDGSYTTTTFTGASISHYLKATGFGFSLDSAAVIDGIQVTIERYETGGTTDYISDNAVYLVKNNVVVGANKAAGLTMWTHAVGSMASYGAADDLWGTTWNAGDINNATFGVALSADVTGSPGSTRTANVDYIRVTVTYHIPVPGAPTLYPSDGTNQIAFNNIRQNSTTPTFRVSATHTESFNGFQIELNTVSNFMGTAYTQNFSGNYSSGTQYNLLANGLSPSLPTTNNATYYVRVRASADGGSSWGQWSTVDYPVWTFTYKSAAGSPDWFQTTDAQFGTGTLNNTETYGSDQVRLSSGGYTERFYTWSASSADTWQKRDLSAYGVPPNAVCEIVIQNSDGSNERYGGVRVTGSSIDRRALVNKAQDGGRNIMVMHVQADDESTIEHYADDTGDISFILAGYWTGATYVEKWQSFTAGASDSWRDRDLSGYGVGANQTVEIVMTNDRSDAEYLAGVRQNGSSLERRVTVQEAEDGGVCTATMMVNADASSIIEVYADSDSYIDFYLAGYWSSPPGTYTEKFSAVTSPSSDATWQDRDLSGTPWYVPGHAVAEIVFGNEDTDEEDEMGVRQNGSALTRYLDIVECEAGGLAAARMHVNADASSIIEVYHEDVSDSHVFYLTGYWELVSSGTITSPAIEFGWVAGATTWGEVQVGATTAANNSVTVQVLNSTGSPISGKNVTIQNGGTSGSINLTDVSPAGGNATLYLRATLTNAGGGTPYLNDWMVTWVTAGPEPSTITVTAPSAIAFDTLVWGDNTKSSATNGTVTVVFGSGSPAGWQVTAQDLTNGGYMKSSNATLANKLQISSNGTTWAYADVGITYNGTGAGNYTLPFWARQVINTNEVVGAYNITIVFTGEILY